MLLIMPVDYNVSIFENALRELAAKNGDRVTSEYKSALDLVQGMDCAIIKMQKNPSWSFRVILRKQEGYGNYHWHILSEDLDFTCSFNGDRYNYFLKGGPAGTDKRGDGEIKSIGTTNFIPTLTWLIGLQKGNCPLTNVTSAPAFANLSAIAYPILPVE